RLGDRLVVALDLDRQAFAVVPAYEDGRLARDHRRGFHFAIVAAHAGTAAAAARSLRNAPRPTSSTRPAITSSKPVASTGKRSPMRSENRPITSGENASPSTWIDSVLTATPRPRMSA